LLGNIVNLALGFVLKDAKAVLAAPEVQLQASEEQVRRVKALMGPWRLALYRLRNNPIQVATAVGLSTALLYVRREDQLVVAATAFVCKAFSQVLPVFALLAGQMLSVLARFCRLVVAIPTVARKAFSKVGPILAILPNQVFWLLALWGKVLTSRE
jgi:hypothetical protein